MSFWDRLVNLDVRILWVLLVVVLLAPMLKPIGLPLPMKAQTRSAYTFAESLPSGSWVVMSINRRPSRSQHSQPLALL